MVEKQEVTGVAPSSRGRSAALRAEPATQSQAKPADANAHEVATLVERFLANSTRPDMVIVMDAVNRGVLAAMDRERRYASKCDGAMMAALALASKSRLGPDLVRTLSMRVAANLLPADGRSQMEREFIASGIKATGNG